MTTEEIPLEEIVYKPTTVKENTSPVFKPEKKPQAFNFFLYLIATIANLLGFAAGIQISWITPVIPKLDESTDVDNPFGRSLTESEISWMAALMPLGATLGPLAAGRIADKVGRKKVLLLIGCIQISSFLITAFAETVYLFYIARILAGVSIGGTFAILPMFMMEISESHNRGTLGCSMNIFVALGFNFAVMIGPYLSIQVYSLICLFPLLIFMPSFFILSPETPDFLASVGDDEILASSLIKLRNKSKDAVQAELTTFLESAQNSSDKSTILDLIRIKSLRKGLIISLGIIMFQQCAGVGAIFSYMQTIFEAAKVNLPAEICVIMVGAFQVFGVILSTAAVDRIGRRILLLGSTAGTCATLSLIGLYFYLKNNGFRVDWISWLPILCLVVFILVFSVGLGPLPWVIVSELFPSNVRSTAASLTSFACFVITFTVTVSFPFLVWFIGMANCFLLFSLICLGGTVFVYLVLPETKGKSLEEIQRLLGGE